MMASDAAAPTPASVQCPVCFNNFTSLTINHHLDVCLLENTTRDAASTSEKSEPPLKRLRVCSEAKPSAPLANDPAPGSSKPPGMFAVFHVAKTRVSPPVDHSGLLTSKQLAFKRTLLSESEPAAVPESRDSGSDIHAVKSRLSPWSLLEKGKPLADILRPDTLEAYFGQNKVIGQQTLFRALLESQEIPSFILWGPPGCGKVSCRFLYINV